MDRDLCWGEFMRQLLIFIGAILTANISEAKTAIEIDLTANSKIHIYHWGVKSGGIRCGNGSNGDYYNAANEYSASRSESISDSKKSGHLSVGAYGYTKGWAKEAEHYGVDYLTSIKTDPSGEQELKVVIEQTQTKIHPYSYTIRCDDNHQQHTLQNAGLTGSIKFNYEVPKGVWAVLITESPHNSIFDVGGRENESQKPLQDGMLLQQLPMGNRLVWVKPGTSISQEFKISTSYNISNGKLPEASNSFVIKFTPMGDLMATEQKFDSNWLLQFVKEVRIIAGTSRGSSVPIAELKQFVEDGFTILRNIEKFREEMKGFSTQKLNDINKNLFKIVISDHSGLPSGQEQTVKTLSALVSYELASLFIEEMASYCHTREVYAPGLDKTIKVQGLRYALFLMDRMQDHLTIGIEDIHGTFLKDLQKLQDRGMKYSDIFKEKGLAEKLRVSFRIVRKLAQPQKRPFAEALQSLSDFYSSFKSVGSDTNSTATVINVLRELTEQEYAFVETLFNKVRDFNPDNHSQINIDNLKRQLAALVESKDKTVSLMRNNMRFLSFEQTSGESSLGAMLTRLRVHNLNVVKHSYKNVEFPFEFENIRSAYVDQGRVDKNVTTVNMCIGIE